ncbi:MAG: ArnT family glycosyltransferase [Armatimonadota bacterium]
MTENQPRTETPVLVWVLMLVVLIWISVVVTRSQLQMSPTYDEQNHVTRGISALRTGDFRLSLHHPPLANIIEALPVAWRPETQFTTGMEPWRTLNIWEASNTTIWKLSKDGLFLIHLARVPVLLFTLGLALLIFCWSRELFGPWGGLTSLSLFALDPNMLAHSGLATTDMAAACTIALGVYLLRRYIFRPTKARFLLAGVGIGLAIAAKYSGLILVPITGLLLLILALWPSPSTQGLSLQWLNTPRIRRIGQVVGLCVLLGCVAGIAVWGVYGFGIEHLGYKPGKVQAESTSLKSRLPIPTIQYLRGLKTVKSEASDHVAYLLGKTDTSGKGWWYYFPVAVAAKTPTIELLAILGILVLLVIPRTRAWFALRREELLILLIPVGVYCLAALGLLGISLNLGIRHVLPMYPFLLILAGGWAVLPVKTKYYPAALGALLVIQLSSVLFAYPNFLAYFNEIAETRKDGYHILADSNYDWGQDLGRLAEYQRTHPSHEPMLFSYFGTTPPEAYGITYLPLPGKGVMSSVPPHNLAKFHGRLAISVTNLVVGPAYTTQDFRPLLDCIPEAQVGKTIIIYRFPLVSMKSSAQLPPRQPGSQQEPDIQIPPTPTR